MSTKRKLAAILSADAAGYSKLMADDEAATVRSLNDARALFRKRIEAHGGRLIDTAGDSILAEFPSAVGAVECAVEIQQELARGNRQFAEHRRMQFRIGINLGDVIEQEDGTIYGDGVNVAARLQALAEPGGICVSGAAYDQVEGKLPLQFKFIGEQQVKNIAKPVRAYRVLSQPEAAVNRVADAKRSTSRLWRYVAVATVSVIVLAIGVVAVRYLSIKANAPESALEERHLRPDRPSIAVLPFSNMSGNPELEHFADGLAEDIITALSKISRIQVTARNSSFQFKNRSVDLREVGRTLGVQYVLEGSIRKDGDRIRINAQLIEATEGTHIWAENYDYGTAQVFDVQDQVQSKILVELGVFLTEGEQVSRWRRGTTNPKAYERLLQAYGFLLTQTREDLAQVDRLINETIGLDPNYAMAYVVLGYNYAMKGVSGFVDDPEAAFETAAGLAGKALKIDGELADAYALLGWIRGLQHRLDEAIELGKRAVRIDPAGAKLHGVLAETLLRAGEPAESINYMWKALRLNPFPPAWYRDTLATAYYANGQPDKVVEIISKLLPSVPPDDEWFQMVYRLHLIAAHVQLGQMKEANALASELLSKFPDLRIDEMTLWTGSLFRDKEKFKEYKQSLRVAGLR